MNIVVQELYLTNLWQRTFFVHFGRILSVRSFSKYCPLSCPGSDEIALSYLNPGSEGSIGQLCGGGRHLSQVVTYFGDTIVPGRPFPSHAVRCRWYGAGCSRTRRGTLMQSMSKSRCCRPNLLSSARPNSCKKAPARARHLSRIPVLFGRWPLSRYAWILYLLRVTTRVSCEGSFAEWRYVDSVLIYHWGWRKLPSFLLADGLGGKEEWCTERGGRLEPPLFARSTCRLQRAIIHP